MKCRSDSLACFTSFKNMGENQFNQGLKLFQCDGAKELVEGVFRSFLDTNDISLRVSCPHTSQQNGIVERKHRHIWEIGLSLLHQALLPRYFWLKAFSTAVFLINKLPTPVLSGRSSYEALFGARPDYTLLRTFGCSCYPFLGDYGQDKLTPKTRRCIFIGYNTIHKGYRYLDSSSGRIFISRLVVFNETEFHYGISSALPTTVSPHVPPPRLPLALTFEPALLSHSQSTVEPLNASTTAPRVEPSSPTVPSTSPDAQSPSPTTLSPPHHF
jgi:hypothetical protein